MLEQGWSWLQPELLKSSQEQRGQSTTSAGPVSVVLTEWDVYRPLDYPRIFDAMAKPAFVFDGRNILDHASLHALGFNVFPIGKKSLRHF